MFLELDWFLGYQQLCDFSLKVANVSWIHAETQEL
jgi:hypothetical protein